MVMLSEEDILTREVLDWEGIHVLHFAGSSCSQKTRIVLALKGVAEAVRRYFQVNNFDIEHRDRHESLFAHMTMPILILQGRWDPGQHPEEYARSSEFAANLRVEFVEANHFAHLENPVACNRAIRRFLDSA